MSHYKIIRTSRYALDFLHKFQTGVVHSVYRKTINIRFDGQLLAIQAEGSPLSPISLISDMSQDEMEKLPVFKDQTVRVSAENLLFLSEDFPSVTVGSSASASDISGISGELSVFKLPFSQAEVFDLKMQSALTDDQLDVLTPQIYDAILHAGTKGFDLIFSESEEVDSNLMMLAGKKRLESATKLLQRYATGQNTCFGQDDNSRPEAGFGQVTGSGQITDPGQDASFLESAATELVHLIGLGIGLTPSGDDFLTGICAGLLLCHMEYSAFSDIIRRLIREHITDTNDISGAFLTCALDGQFSQSVNSLWQRPEQSSDEILKSFAKIGHSSGVDSLCGIFYVLKVIRFI